MDKKVKKIVESSKKDKSILAVAFFGSYAREEKFRDIDVCIFLAPKKYSPTELSMKKMKYTLEDEKYDVQIFQQLPLYIRKQILKEAKIIYCKDEDLLYDLYFETLRDFELFKPIYEGYLEAVANE
ncbi:MAG: nucleotidyltransferase domain-containing protein [Nanoarchaeota archaeon]|nr:nucleotidyltransferase domain-containing protein [Nanoarchaeota archaeon]MBU1876522.1 nucleotidyltransferase domain-containing protein [Nanoarchaeota archaeon]